VDDIFDTDRDAPQGRARIWPGIAIQETLSFPAQALKAMRLRHEGHDLRLELAKARLKLVDEM
jgi:hypothetical protein